MSDENTTPDKESEEPRTESSEGDAAGAVYPPGLGPEPTSDKETIRQKLAEEEGEGDDGGEATESSAESSDSGSYNSGDHTVDEVIADVDAGKVSAQEALDSEKAGQNRSTLVSQLESRGAS